MMAQVKKVQVSSITVPEVRVTAVYDPELQDQLESTLEKAGQIVPIILVETEVGLELVDGFHRLEDAKRRGDKTIEAKVISGSSDDALLLNLVTNRTRGKVKASEMVQVINELVNNRGLDSVQVQDRTGLTREYIERLWKIADSHPMILEALDRELIGVGVAFEVARLPAAEQQAAVMSTVQVFHMTIAQARSLVDETLEQMQVPIETTPAVAPQPPPPPTCEACKGPADTNLLVAIQLCPRCFGRVGLMIEQDKAAEVLASASRDGHETP